MYELLRERGVAPGGKMKAVHVLLFVNEAMNNC